MKQLKRLLLIIGFVPVILIGGVLWIFTGKDAIKLAEKFEDWCTS